MLLSKQWREQEMMSAQVSGDRQPPVTTAEEPFKVWQCVLCGFTYDEAAGLPADGIPPGTRWIDVPADWICPDCSATKSDFEMVEI
jgi:rubredoxin